MPKLDDFRLTLGGREYVPLLQGGMGVDISTSELALEVARLGGIGHISDAMGPFVSDRKYGTRYQANKGKRFREFADSMDKSQVKWTEEDAYQATKNHVEGTITQKRGPGAVFVNVMEKLQLGAPEETLRGRMRACMDGGADGITLSAGLHTGSLKLIEDQPRFRDISIGIIVSSVRALKIFLRSSKRVDRNPDFVIVEGPLAGGHLGFGLDWKNYQLKTIVAEVVEFLKENDLDIPVVPAGGVFTGTDAVEYLQSGASAVQVATRFTISEECGYPEHVKQKLLQAREEDVEVNMTSPTGYPMRMLKCSPSKTSNIKPNCESLGYILDRNGQCGYHEAYEKAGVDAKGRKLPVHDKMCICYHFMKYECYTCGHYVYRLKDTTHQLSDGKFQLLSAEHIFNDYVHSEEHQILLPELALSGNSANGASVNGTSSNGTTATNDLESTQRSL